MWRHLQQLPNVYHPHECHAPQSKAGWCAKCQLLQLVWWEQRLPSNIKRGLINIVVTAKHSSCPQRLEFYMEKIYDKQPLRTLELNYCSPGWRPGHWLLEAAPSFLRFCCHFLRSARETGIISGLWCFPCASRAFSELAAEEDYPERCWFSSRIVRHNEIRQPP